MKLKACFVGMFALAMLVAAAPHTWFLKNGSSVEGDYFSSGTTTVVLKRSGTNYFLKISDLSTNDLAYLSEMQAAQKQARLDAETNQMAKTGMIEFTANLIKNFPEKVDNQHGWMDAKYVNLDEFAGRYASNLGFDVWDKDGNFFNHCYVEKSENDLVNTLTKLKAGDRIRLVGLVEVQSGYRWMDGTPPDSWFFVGKIEMIESAAEKQAREDAGANLPDTTK